MQGLGRERRWRGAGRSELCTLHLTPRRRRYSARSASTGLMRSAQYSGPMQAASITAVTAHAPEVSTIGLSGSVTKLRLRSRRTLKSGNEKRLAALGAHVHDFLRARVREGMDHERLQHAEQRRRRADPEREREHSGHRERRRGDELAEGQAQIIHGRRTAHCRESASDTPAGARTDARLDWGSVVIGHHGGKEGVCERKRRIGTRERDRMSEPRGRKSEIGLLV